MIETAANNTFFRQAKQLAFSIKVIDIPCMTTSIKLVVLISVFKVTLCIGAFSPIFIHFLVPSNTIQEQRYLLYLF
jgi:hypothetical protein